MHVATGNTVFENSQEVLLDTAPHIRAMRKSLPYKRPRQSGQGD